MAVNARGSFFFAREAFRAMQNRGGGAIVNTGSCAGTVALPKGAVYSTSKGAPAQLTKVLAVEGGPVGIRADIVAAGVIETDFLASPRSTFVTGAVVAADGGFAAV